MKDSVAELLERLQLLDEHDRIEAKRGSSCGDSMMETVCAFANEPGLNGGFLLLGVEAAEQEVSGQRYRICGVSDPDKLLNDISSNCRTQFNQPVRIHTTTEEVEGKVVVAVQVDEALPADKPIFFTRKPLPKSAWRRGPNGDYQCNERDLAELYRQKDQAAYDMTEVPGATLDDIDPNALSEYRKARAAVNPAAEELQYSDTDLLKALNCVVTKNGSLIPTVAGIVLFGSRLSLRRLFPMLRLDYIRVEGKEWVEDPEKRFSTIDMRDSLARLATRTVAAILDDLPKSFHLPNGALQNQGEYLIPYKVIREAVVNALMHRNYQKAEPIQIIRYSNRLELRNPGYSLKDVEEFSTPGSKPRNQAIAAVLHEINLAETKGSGIRTMRTLMEQAGLAAPSFDSDRYRDTFVATYLFHHFLSEDDINWLAGFKDQELENDEMRALIFVREAGRITNADYRELCKVDTLQASHHLARLRDLGFLEQVPKGPSTYYECGALMLNQPPASVAASESLGTSAGISQLSLELPPLSSELPPLSSELPPLSSELPPLSSELPPLSSELPKLSAELLVQIESLGERSHDRGQLTRLILQLCQEQSYSAQELAQLLKRRAEYLLQSYLRPLIKTGELRYKFPDEPNHPQQAYCTAKEER